MLPSFSIRITTNNILFNLLLFASLSLCCLTDSRYPAEAYSLSDTIALYNNGDTSMITKHNFEKIITLALSQNTSQQKNLFNLLVLILKNLSSFEPLMKKSKFQDLYFKTLKICPVSKIKYLTKIFAEHLSGTGEAKFNSPCFFGTLYVELICFQNKIMRLERTEENYCLLFCNVYVILNLYKGLYIHSNNVEYHIGKVIEEGYNKEYYHVYNEIMLYTINNVLYYDSGRYVLYRSSSMNDGFLIKIIDFIYKNFEPYNFDLTNITKDLSEDSLTTENVCNTSNLEKTTSYLLYSYLQSSKTLKEYDYIVLVCCIKNEIKHLNNLETKQEKKSFFLNSLTRSCILNVFHIQPETTVSEYNIRVMKFISSWTQNFFSEEICELIFENNETLINKIKQDNKKKPANLTLFNKEYSFGLTKTAFNILILKYFPNYKNSLEQNMINIEKKLFKAAKFESGQVEQQNYYNQEDFLKIIREQFADTYYQLIKSLDEIETIEILSKEDKEFIYQNYEIFGKFYERMARYLRRRYRTKEYDVVLKLADKATERLKKLHFKQ